LSLGKTIGKKLSELQKSYSLNQEEMGSIINVSRQTMAKYLKGEQIPDGEKLWKLSQHFNKPLNYFLSLPEESTRFSFLYRAELVPEGPPMEFPYLEKRFNNYFELIQLSSLSIKEYMPEYYDLEFKSKDLSKEDKKTIEKIALKQRNHMGIGDAINIDIYTVLENNHINLIAEPLEDSEIDAVSAYARGKGAFIFVNDRDDITEERKIFSTIHELGHLIMHRKHYTSGFKSPNSSDKRKRDIREKAADYFASCFLVPPHVLKENFSYELKGFISLSTIINLKEEFGISAQAFITSINKFGLITQPTMGALLKQLNKQGYAKTEPNPKAKIRKNHKLHSLTRTLLLEENISLNKALEFLGKTVSDPREKIKEWYADYE